MPLVCTLENVREPACEQRVARVADIQPAEEQRGGQITAGSGKFHQRTEDVFSVDMVSRCEVQPLMRAYYRQ
jgi:hypothetical protein